MDVNSHEIATDSPKAEVGEIDTRAPFESVKAAVSLFGEGAFSADKSIPRKPKPQSVERQKSLAKETQLHLAQKELNKLKDQLSNAETTRVQALTELHTARKTVEVLTDKLNTITESKESALTATEVAKGLTKQLEEVISNDGDGQDGAWKRELNSAREQYAIAITELDAAKQELRTIKTDFDASVDSKFSAFHQEAEAKQLSDANTEKVTHLLKEIAAAQESLMHVKLATGQARQEESMIHSEKDSRRQSYGLALQETEKKLESLNKEFDTELGSCYLEAKLAGTAAEIGAIQKEMESARVSELESVSELDDAKVVLQEVAEEESCPKSLVESLKLELEAVKEEHSELKDKDTEIESIAGNLQVHLRKCKAELEKAMAAESQVSSGSDEMTSTLQQLSVESKSAMQEAESTKKRAEELRHEAEAAQITLAEMEKKLQMALGDAEEAKAAETRALDKIKELSERANASRHSTSEYGARITISTEEYDSLSQKVEESERLAEMKVAAASTQVEAVRASENEAVKRLEAARKEMEDMAIATEEALKRAEMAGAAKRAVEGEMRKWREREEKKAAEAASRILAETTEMSEDQPPLRADTTERSEVHRKVYRPSVSRKTLLPGLNGIFQRRKSQVDGGPESYLPGEKPV